MLVRPATRHSERLLQRPELRVVEDRWNLIGDRVIPLPPRVGADQRFGQESAPQVVGIPARLTFLTPAGVPRPRKATLVIQHLSDLSERRPSLRDEFDSAPDRLGLVLVDSKPLLLHLMPEGRRTTDPNSLPCTCATSTHAALCDSASFEVSERSKDVSQELSCQFVRVESLCDGHEGNAEGIEFSDRVDEMLYGAREAIELRYDDDLDLLLPTRPHQPVEVRTRLLRTRHPCIYELV